MSPQILREAEEIASTCYRTKPYKLPAPDPQAVEEAQRALLAKAAKRCEERADQSWGK